MASLDLEVSRVKEPVMSLPLVLLKSHEFLDLPHESVFIRSKTKLCCEISTPLKLTEDQMNCSSKNPGAKVYKGKFDMELDPFW